MKEQRRRIRRKNIGYKKFILLLIMIFLAVFLLFKVVPSTARYVYNVVKTFYLNTREFYFNSNRLSVDNDEFTAENWDGSEAYPIKVIMNSINNKNVYAPMDIEYEVKMSYKVFHSNGTEYSETELANANIQVYFSTDLAATSDENIKKGVIYSANTGAAHDNTDTFIVYVSKKGTGTDLEDKDYVIVSLTANSISPYKKTITGDFTVKIGNLGLSYKIEDEENDPYLKAIVTNTLGEAKIITLAFNPDDVVFDSTLKYETTSTTTKTGVASETSGDSNTYTFTNSITFKIDAEESKTIRFYKIDSTKNYSYPDNTSTPVVTFSYTDAPATT